MFRKWGWLALWMVLGLTGGAVGGAEPNPEEVRKLMEKYERQAAPPKPAPAPKPKPKPAPVEVESASAPVVGGPKMVSIRGGRFQMGSPASEIGREPLEANERQHDVSVKDFELGQTEVTVGEFRRFVNATGHRTDAERNAGGKEGCYAWSATTGQWDWRAGTDWRNPGFPQRDNYPVVCVSWNDAVAYTAWLSREMGQRYRLPTEAEWEYAARAGTTTARYWGDDPDQACAYANVADQTKAPEGNSWTQKHECNDGYWYPAPVGRFRANDWRLNDMLGNVWEWTCSAYDKEYGGAELKCTSKDTTGPRAVRGGSWNYLPAWVRSAYRYGDAPTDRNILAGFRLARSL